MLVPYQAFVVSPPILGLTNFCQKCSNVTPGQMLIYSDIFMTIALTVRL